MTDDDFYRELEELGPDEVERRLAEKKYAEKIERIAELSVQRHKSDVDADRHQDHIDRMDEANEISRSARNIARWALGLSVLVLTLHLATWISGIAE